MENIYIMKCKLFIINILLLSVLVSCVSKDDYKSEVIMTVAAPVFDTSPLGVKQKLMYDNYGVIFTPDFDIMDYRYDWTDFLSFELNTGIGHRVTAGDKNYAAEVIDSVDTWFLKIFPKAFIKAKLPRHILLADSLYRSLGSATTSKFFVESRIATNFTILGHTSSRFATYKKSRMIIESWVSIFIEKMLTSGTLSAPAAFSAYSKDGYALDPTKNTTDMVTSYAMLKTSREKQTNTTATSFKPTTVNQDFGDFVAFIIYVPDSAKALIYAKNPFVEKKVAIVKAYFLDNFNITLPYIPRNP